MCFEKNRKSWNIQEENLLKQLYEALGPKSWKKISKQFKKHGFRRKEIQIRQKWVNHMDPDILSSNWHHQQLQMLYRAFDSIGSKWCIIKKQIPGRTQVKIKNKFYSNLRVYIRFVALFFEGKNCKNKQLINRIPPNILNQIYNGEKRFEFFKDEFKKVLLQMDYIIDKTILEKRIQENIYLYEQFNKQLNEVFVQITTNEQFRNVLQNNESYYSDFQSDKTKRIKTKTKIGSNIVFKQSNVESTPAVKQEQDVEIRNYTYDKQILQDKRWTSVIVIQPRKISPQPIYYYEVYYPWQLVKIQ